LKRKRGETGGGENRKSPWSEIKGHKKGPKGQREKKRGVLQKRLNPVGGP